MRVLIISYLFAPMNWIGAVRWSKLGKYMVREGCQVKVISALQPQDEKRDDTICSKEIPEDAILRTGEFSTRMTGWLKRVFNGLEKKKGFIPRTLWGVISFFLGPGKFSWYFKTRPLVKKTVKEWQPDVVITTFDPIANHRLGRYAKKVCPDLLWAADFRDPMCSEFFLNQCRNRMERILVGGYEHSKKRLLGKFLSSADLIINVYERDNEWQRAHFPQLKDLAHKQLTLTNGFDPEEGGGIEPLAFDEKAVNIVYSGTLRPDNDATLLFHAMNELRGQVPVRLHYFGKHSAEMMRRARQADVEDLVVDHGLVARSEMLGRMAAADVLLLMCGGNTQVDIVPAKLYEYILAKRPVLALVSGIKRDTLAARMVSEGRLGLSCEYIAGPGTEPMKAFFKAIYDGEYNFDPDEAAFEGYTHPRLAADLLEQLQTRIGGAVK